jgi:hypothetical protein
MSHPWSGLVRLTSSNSLISNEEAAQVIVRVERIHDEGKSIALATIPLRRSLVDLRVERVEIQPDIDAGISKCLHARIVVALGINVVHADRVCANCLHEVGIQGALRRGDERVLGDELVRDAYEIVNINCTHLSRNQCLPLT